MKTGERPSPRVSLIVAATADGVIGVGGDLPWRLRGDLRRFKWLTAGHTVVVGRLTHESIVRRLGKPLPGRTTILVTRAVSTSDAASRAPSGDASDTASHAPPAENPSEAVLLAPSVKEALALAAERETGGEVFVIGGAQVYTAALPFVSRIYLTRVHVPVAGDTVLPPDWLDGFTLVSEEPGTPGESPEHSYLVYERS